MIRDWAAKHGFNLFPERIRVVTSPASATAPGPEAGRRRAEAAKARQGPRILIDGGYGKIKGTTFRISNMGDETPATMQSLCAALDEA